MFKNYLKIAFRNIKRYKVYSLINISGLVIGITCFILIMLFVQYELSFDKFHKNIDQIYRIIHKMPRLSRMGNELFAHTQWLLAPTIKREFPEVINAARIQYLYNKKNIRYLNKPFLENGIFADNEFLNIFTFPLLKGDKNSALGEPNSIVISENLAKKFFGDEEPIGKILHYEDLYTLTVTGVHFAIPAYQQNWTCESLASLLLWRFRDIQDDELKMAGIY